MWHVKKFEELSLTELEQILKMRQDIFIIEQESLFSDIDGKDQEATHLMKKEGDVITAYCRILVGDNVNINRVVVNKDHRGNGMGRELFQYAMDYAKDTYPNKKIEIIAMAYLDEFYSSFGFKAVSDTYDIAGHDHFDMEYTP